MNLKVSIDTHAQLDALLLDDAQGRAYRHVRAKIQEVFDAAYRTWPVKTGKSRDSLRIYSGVYGDTWEVTLSNDENVANYSQYVKLVGIGPTQLKSEAIRDSDGWTVGMYRTEVKAKTRWAVTDLLQIPMRELEPILQDDYARIISEG